MSLSAIYLCVACSAGALPEDGASTDTGQIPMVSADDATTFSLPEAALSPSMAIVQAIEQAPATDAEPVEPEPAVPIRVVSVDTTPLGAANPDPVLPVEPVAPVEPVDLVDPATPPDTVTPVDPEPAPVEPDPEPAPAEPDPEPAPVEPDPEPEPVEPDPEPAPVEPDPEPAPVEPDPEPAPVEPDPEPAPVEPDPEPAPVEPDPEPSPVEPDPEPAPVEPDPEPAPVEPDPEPSAPTSNSGGGLTMTFAQIEAAGLSNACYMDDDHYVAEFMYQNPDVCFWDLDSDNQTVSAVATPTPPSNAIQLPAPSGGNDTSMLESVINSNQGKSLVGQGTYKVSGLDINVSVDIFNMPMEPVSGAGDIVRINASDVRIFSSPIDAKGSSTVTTGFEVSNGSHRFTLVDSGFSNIYHRNHENAAGVYIRGADDFYVACNTFENIVNDTSRSDKTARANAIWMNGGHNQTTSGGYIVSNYAREHQSNGKLKDSEFFTQQSYTSTSIQHPVKIYANRTLDAGKRFTKHQEDNAKVLSNFHEWAVKSGPLGNRALLSHVEVQFSDNVEARNNRVKIGAGSRYDYVFITQVQYGTDIQDNIHYDCNDIEITDQLDPNSNNIPQIITARMSTKPRDSTGFEATNSSANNNFVHGDGSVRYFFSFDHGYDDRGGRFEATGNVFEIDFLNAIYR
ncbi:MAG: hypothetical protein AB8B64_03815 [Granulosicoccus sp.]